MANPSFSASGVSTLTFSRGYVFPVPKAVTWNQVRQVSEDGTRVMVADLGDPTIEFELEFQRVPLADYQALEAFLLHANINGSGHPFTYTDVNSVATLVRYWPPLGSPVQLAWPEVAYQQYSGRLPLRKELS